MVKTPCRSNRARSLFRAFFLVGGLLLILQGGFVSVARAAITVLHEYHLGESDPGAVPDNEVTTSVDSVGGADLTFFNGPLYSSDVETNEGASTLSLFLDGTDYGSAPFTNNLTDNFGVEVWVKPVGTSNEQYLFYSGYPDSSGWGVLQSGPQFFVRFGGSIEFGSAPVATNVWNDVVLVRDSGKATLYVNGLPYQSSPVEPNFPTPATSLVVGSYDLGVPQNFEGGMDELRVFSVVPGTFSLGDLQLGGVLPPPPPLGFQATLLSNNLVLSWNNDHAHRLQSSTDLSSTNNWTWICGQAACGGNYTVSNISSGPATFYRLSTPPPVTSTPAVTLTVYLYKTATTAKILTPDFSPGHVAVAIGSPIRTVLQVTPQDCLEGDSDLEYSWVLTMFGGSLESLDYVSQGMTGFHTSTFTLGPQSVPSPSTSTIYLTVTRRSTGEIVNYACAAESASSGLSVEQCEICQSQQTACDTCPCTIANALPGDPDDQ